MQVNRFLENAAEKYPDKKAIWYQDNWMTFLEIDQASNQLANYLRKSGVKRGDRVAILYENSFNYVIGYYAILKAGGVTVALNTETTVDSLKYLLTNSGAKGIISNNRFSKYLMPALTDVPALDVAILDQDDISEYEKIKHLVPARLTDVLKSESKSHPGVRCIDIDLASIVYTSGSTGKPKGVTLSHLNIISNTRSIVEYLKLSPDDRIMDVLPFYYIYGKSLLNTHFFVGGSVVIDNRFAFPNVILETMKKTEVTGFSGVPSTFMILLNKSSVRNYKFSHLRYLTQAGGPMAPSVQKEVVNVFSPAQLYVMYGATEASARLSYLDPADLPRKWGSIGKAIPNVDLFVADNLGNPLPPEEVGEIVARGSNFMQGYWKDSEETSRVMRNGLYYTGDIGKMDEEGFVYVVGRSKDMVKVGGERVSAKEVEEALLELDGIHEIAIIGVEDDILGEAMKAYIVLNPGSDLEEADVLSYGKAKLPSYKVPKFVEFMDNLPKNKSGKIMKTRLKALANQG